MHIPYRNSKLTRLLQDSLGGNCITTFMGMISPGQENFSESVSTLKFANRTKKIKNKPKINEELDQELLIKKYEEELLRLRKVMSDRRKIMGQSKLLQLEEERERAEAHRDQMMQRLQEKSREFLEEREEKLKLEIKISHLESEVNRYKRLKKELQPGDWGQEEDGDGLIKIEKRLKELEEQKGHVVEYQDLLKRQKDIIVALTNRLEERDEAITHLQTELKAFDQIYSDLEQFVKIKDWQLKYLARRLGERGMSADELLEGFDEFEMEQKWNEPGKKKKCAREEEKRENMESNLGKLDLAKNEVENVQIKGKVGLGQMKTRIDMIVDELAEKRKGDELEGVAKDLLGLQKMIGEVWERQIEQKKEAREEPNEEQEDANKAEKSGPNQERGETEKFVLNWPMENADKSHLEKRFSEKPKHEEVDMRQINYESLFEKDKLVRKETEDGIENLVAKANGKGSEKMRVFENILSKFEQVKSSILDFNRKGENKENKEKPKNQENLEKKENKPTQANPAKTGKISKKQPRKSKQRPNSVFRESKTRTDNTQKKKQLGSKKDSFSQSRQRNKSFSSSKFGPEPKSAKKRLRGKMGSFLSRKSGNFNEVNSKLQSLLSSGKRNGYLDCKNSARINRTEKKIEGLLRENNIVNLIPKTPNLK